MAAHLCLDLAGRPDAAVMAQAEVSEFLDCPVPFSVFSTYTGKPMPWSSQF